jgi:hypothetical protein
MGLNQEEQAEVSGLQQKESNGTITNDERQRLEELRKKK